MEFLANVASIWTANNRSLLNNSNPKKMQIASLHGKFIYTVFKEVICLGFKDGCLTLVNRKDLKVLSDVKVHDSKIVSLKVVGSQLLTASKESIKIWNLNKKDFAKPEVCLEAPEEGEYFYKVAFDGTHIAANSKIPTSEDGVLCESVIRFWNTASTTKVATLDKYFTKCCFVKNYGILELAGEVVVWDFQTMTEVARRDSGDYENCHLWGVHQKKFVVCQGEKENKKLSLFSFPNFQLEWQGSLTTSGELYFFKDLLCFEETFEEENEEMTHCQVLDIKSGQFKEVARFKCEELEGDFHLKAYDSSVLFISKDMLGIYKKGECSELLGWDYKTWTKVKIKEEVLYYIGQENILHIVDFNEENKEDMQIDELSDSKQ